MRRSIAARSFQRRGFEPRSSRRCFVRFRDIEGAVEPDTVELSCDVCGVLLCLQIVLCDLDLLLVAAELDIVTSATSAMRVTCTSRRFS